jgi:hypothetical protein
MRNVRAIICIAALTVLSTACSEPARAHERWPAVPAEVGTGVPSDRVVWIPYRCTDGPVHNFYHGAYYGGQAPAVFLDHAYRPFYRYTAYRILPRTYFCSGRHLRWNGAVRFRG